MTAHQAAAADKAARPLRDVLAPVARICARWEHLINGRACNADRSSVERALRLYFAQGVRRGRGV
jgi:hypothetical protein